MHDFTTADNPLRSKSMQDWNDLIEAVGPASLLVLIDQKMGAVIKAHHAPEDIFQDALLHAWRDRDQFQWTGLRNFRMWLISIIDHRIYDAIDHAEAQKRGGSITHHRINGSGSSSEHVNVPLDSTTPSRIAIYKEQAGAMREVLASLPSEWKDVVRLRLFEQLPLESIATHLGIGVAAVRHRFRKGAELYHRRLQAVLISRSGEQSQNFAPHSDQNSSSSG